MAFAAGSDRFVAVAWDVGLGALAITVALALQVLVMRERALRRERRRDALFAAWRPLMFAAVVGEAPPLPRLARRDADAFLLLWNQLQDGVRGEARARLNALAASVGAHAMAHARLRRDDALGRLLAVRTLGHLGCGADYDAVAHELEDRRSYLGLAAARALVSIDPVRAPGDVLPRLASRADWPVALFATVLGEADGAALTAAFRDVQRALESAAVVRLLPLASIIDVAEGEALLTELLASPDPEVLAAALKAVRTPALLAGVRRACTHGSWAVRTQAAAALGRVGASEDRDALVGLLGDRQWWVRYRAAQALASGRFGSAAEIATLGAGLDDRYARDIVEHVLAEGRT